MKKTKCFVFYITVILLNAVCIFSLAENRNITKDYESKNILSYEYLCRECSAISEPEEKTIKIHHIL